MNGGQFSLGVAEGSVGWSVGRSVGRWIGWGYLGLAWLILAKTGDVGNKKQRGNAVGGKRNTKESEGR